MNDEPEAVVALRRQLGDAREQLRLAKLEEARAIYAVDKVEGLMNRLLGMMRGGHAEQVARAEANARVAIARRQADQETYNTLAAQLEPGRLARSEANRLAQASIDEVAHLSDEGRAQVIALRAAISERQPLGRALQAGQMALRQLESFGDHLRSGALTQQNMVVPGPRGSRVAADPGTSAKFTQALVSRTNAEAAVQAFLALVPGATVRVTYSQLVLGGDTSSVAVSEMGRVTDALIFDVKQNLEIVRIEEELEAEDEALKAMQAELQALLQAPRDAAASVPQ